jgi:hypothetical protein
LGLKVRLMLISFHFYGVAPQPLRVREDDGFSTMDIDRVTHE